MEHQLNNNQSANSTVKIFGDNASPLFAVISMILSLWIIVSNFFVLICFIKHRNSLIRSTFTVQILTLSFSDCLVGLSTLPVYVTSFSSMASYELCVFQFVIFISAQEVALCHIFGICLTRLFVVCNLTSRAKMSQKTGLITLYLIISWIVSLGIFATPFGVWGKYRQELCICSLNEMFQDNYKVYTTFSISFYIVPTLLTNVFYVAVLVKIRISSRKIVVMNAPISDKDIFTRSHLGQDSGSEEHSKAKWKITYVQPLNKKENDTITMDETPGVSATTFEKISSIEHTEDKTQTTELFALRKSNTENEGNVTNRNESNGARSHQSKPGYTRQHQTSIHMSTVNSHTKAISTIGMDILHYLS